MTSSPISKDMGALLHLTDHAAYEHATGRRRKGLDDYARAIDHIGRRSGTHPSCAAHPKETACRPSRRWRRRHRAQVSSDGNARLHLAEDPTEWMPLSHAANAFERHLARNVDVPTEWSHLGPALVEQLMPNLVEKKGGFALVRSLTSHQPT